MRRRLTPRLLLSLLLPTLLLSGCYGQSRFDRMPIFATPFQP
jgi:hypothetical protein